MKITLIKQLNGTFKVAYNSDYDIAKKIKVNEPIEFEFKNKRNIRFHRKFFALLNMVYENQEIYNNIDHLRNDLTIASGYYYERANIHGEVIIDPKSINFASMEQIEFNEFYNAILDTITKYFNFDKQDIIDNINQFF